MKQQQLEELNDLVFRCNYLQCAFNMLRTTMHDANNLISGEEMHDTLIIYTTYLDHIADDLQDFYDKMELQVHEYMRKELQQYEHE